MHFVHEKILRHFCLRYTDYEVQKNAVLVNYY